MWRSAAVQTRVRMDIKVDVVAGAGLQRWLIDGMNVELRSPRFSSVARKPCWLLHESAAHTPRLLWLRLHGGGGLAGLHRQGTSPLAILSSASEPRPACFLYYSSRGGVVLKIRASENRKT